MQYTTLGRTGLRVSRLGFGCMRLPMKERHVDRDLSTPMLRRAVELGVNYFDSAVGYCNNESQQALGEAMEGIRDRVILSTKNPHYNKKDEKSWWKNLEDSLERMRTPYLDIYKFHGLRWERFQAEVDGPDGQIQWMLRAKEQGLIRHICFSFHDTAENLKKLASTGYFDVVTLQYNLLDRSNEPAFEHVAKTCGMGIVVMGPVGGGRLGGASEEMRRILPGARSVPEVALRFVLANPWVSIALSGMSTMEQLEENVVVASRPTPLSGVERRRVTAVLARYKKLADLYCTGCNYCMPCPSGVNISGNFMALNYQRVYGLRERAREGYARLGGGQAAYCMACGKCLPKCPQNIDIIKQLQETTRTLDQAYGHLVARVMPTSLKSLRLSGGRWSATLTGKLDLRSLSDEPVRAKASFQPPAGTEVKPRESETQLDAFGRGSVRLEISAQSDGGPNLVDTGAAVEGGEKVDLAAGAFRVAFAAPAGKSPAAALRKAVPVRLDAAEQMAQGTRRALARHGATVRLAYDDEGLRIAADVRDDVLRPATAGLPAHRTDRIALLIDARPSLLLGRPALYDRQVFEILFLAPGKDGVPVAHVGRPRGVDAGPIACKCVAAADGYRVTAKVPWGLLGLGKAARRHVGLDVALHSYNRRGEPALEMFWASGKSPGRPDHYGHLFLAE